MKKKIISFVLLATMSVSPLLGCGSSSQNSSANTDNAIVEASSESDMTGTVDTVASALEVKDGMVDGDSVVYESDYAIITMSAIDTTSASGGKVTISYENQTDKSINFSPLDMWINGYQIEMEGFFAEVAAGEKVTRDDCSITLTAFKELGLDNVGELYFICELRDSESGEYLEYAKVGYRTADYANMDTSMGNPVEIGSWEDVTVSIEYVKEGYLAPGVVIFVENSGERNLGVHLRDWKVNGTDISGFVMPTVYAGNTIVNTIPYINGGEGMQSGDVVEITMKVVDADTGEMLYEAEAPITYTVK